jgi:hypothetical protein
MILLYYLKSKAELDVIVESVVSTCYDKIHVPSGERERSAF